MGSRLLLWVLPPAGFTPAIQGDQGAALGIWVLLPLERAMGGIFPSSMPALCLL